MRHSPDLRSLPRRNPSNKRMLIIRFSSIGDIVLTTPVIRGLNRHFPELKIDYLIKEQFRDLIAHHPGVDRVKTIPHDLPFRELIQLRQQIQSSGEYDYLLDLHDNLRSRILTFRSRVPCARYRKNRFRRWLFIYWKIRSPQAEKYITDRYFETVHSFGVEDDGAGLDFYFPADFGYRSPALRNRVEQFHEAELPVTVAPGAAWQTKIWMPDRFAQTCERLITELNADIALLGGSGEKELAAHLLSAAAVPKEKIHNFVGETTLLESAKILQGARMHLANDSGLTHIATAFRIPVVVILGPTAKPTVFHPKYTRHEIVEDEDLRCRPCTHMGRKRCPLGHFRCMQNIQVEDVFSACGRMLGQ